MANTYHKIYLQTVFACKYRKAVLEKSLRSQVFGVLGTLINEHNGKTLIVNGVEDHVHCFFSLEPKMSVSDIMKNIKAKSSKYINDHRLTPERFEWQVGFGAFSYARRDVEMIYDYVNKQEEHHRVVTFRDEYLGLLKEFDISFDEKYLFHDLI